MFAVLLGLILSGFSDAQTRRKTRQQRAKICGDPTAPCKSIATFETYDLAFRVPANAVIWETEKFYAIILKSVKQDDNCEHFISEDARLEAQALFPKNKVFTSRCESSATLYYTGVDNKYFFMAVYGGATRAEAARVLEAVKATGKFPGANIRQMSTGLNGT
jgi:hypothetical protein